MVTRLRSTPAIAAACMGLWWSASVQGSVLLGNFAMPSNSEVVPNTETTIDIALISFSSPISVNDSDNTVPLVVPSSGAVVFDALTNATAFAGFVANFTDGVDQVFYADLKQTGPFGFGGTGILEHNLFASITLNGIDLAGFLIDRIVVNYSLTGSVPGGPPNTQRVSADFSLDVFGERMALPAPGTLLLAGGGLALLGRRRRRVATDRPAPRGR